MANSTIERIRRSLECCADEHCADCRACEYNGIGIVSGADGGCESLDSSEGLESEESASQPPRLPTERVQSRPLPFVCSSFTDAGN